MSARGTFFVTEGTLASGSASYVARQADRALLDALRGGEFAYVLDSRQKGKSSLMIRTREALEAEGIRTVLLDLQRFGSNLEPERWYASLLLVVGEQLGIEDRLFELWDAQVHAGPMRKFFGALEQGISEPCVVFVDEIDFVRSLPFSTDEFFAGIRECHNRRASGQDSGLTFCLLGVATPSELIRDVRITPFNVGKRIELTDFTLAELEPYKYPLSEGGRDGAALLRRIHHWTGGHPYLTQKLASAVTADQTVRTPGGVDRLVEAMFFSLKARSEEPNLSDVSRRVLESPIEGVSPEEARARVLDLYRQVREKKVRDDDTDPVVSVLKLSGLTAVLEGYLVVRNRVYFKAFDKAWVESNLPEAEALRQSRAAKRAALRVGVVAGAISLAIGGLAIFGFAQANRAGAEASRATVALADAQAQRKVAAARAEEAEAAVALANARAQSEAAAKQLAKSAETKATQKAQEATEALGARNIALGRAQAANRQALDARANSNHLLYQANMNLIQTAFESNDFGRVNQLIAESSKPEFAQFAGPELGYWNLRMNPPGVWRTKGRAQFGANGKLVLVETDAGIRILDTASGAEIRRLPNQGPDRLWGGQVLDNGSRFACLSSRGVQIRELPSTRLIFSMAGQTSIQRIPDDRKVITLDRTAQVCSVWDVRSGGLLGQARGGGFRTRVVRDCSKQGDRMVTSDGNGRYPTLLWDLETGRTIKGHDGALLYANLARFSPDGQYLVASTTRQTVLLSARDGTRVRSLGGITGVLDQITFSLDGSKILATTSGRGDRNPLGSAAPKAYAWRKESEIPEYTIVNSDTSRGRTWIQLSPDGDTAAFGSTDVGRVTVFEVATGNRVASLGRTATGYVPAELSRDGARVLTRPYDNVAEVWQVRPARLIRTILGTGAHLSRIRSLPQVANTVSLATIAPDGESCAVNSRDGVATICSLSVLDGIGLGPLKSARFTEEGERILAWGNKLWIADGWTGRPIKWLASSPVRHAAISRRAERVIAQLENGGVASWRSPEFTERLLSAVTIPDAVYAAPELRFGADDRTVLAGWPNDGHWEEWIGLDSTREPKRLSWISVPSVSPKGDRYLACGKYKAGVVDERSTLFVLSQSTKKVLMRLEGHSSPIRSAEFTSDGKRVISISSDSVYLWDASNGRAVLRLEGGSGPASISADQSRLLLGSSIWPLSPEAASRMNLGRPSK